MSKVTEDMLPELPEPINMGFYTDSTMRAQTIKGYTREQMRDYARAALAATGKHSGSGLSDKEIDSRLDVLYRNMVASGQHSGGMLGAAWNRAVYRDASSGKQAATASRETVEVDCIDLGEFREPVHYWLHSIGGYANAASLFGPATRAVYAAKAAQAKRLLALIDQRDGEK